MTRTHDAPGEFAEDWPRAELAQAFQSAVFRGVADRPAVLLALRDSTRPFGALVRAYDLARALGADLHVMRVLEQLQRTQRSPHQHQLLEAAASARRSLEALRSTKQWVEQCLGVEPPFSRIRIVRGNFDDHVRQLSRSLGAALVVVAAEGAIGEDVAALATKSGVPVLVAHDVTGSPVIVAGTDLASVGNPVLTHAARFARVLAAPLVAVHAVPPVPSARGVQSASEVGPHPAALGTVMDEARRLEAATRSLDADSHPEIRSAPRPAEAILGAASERDADLVFVGVHHTAAARRTRPSRRIAAEVVNRANCSVVVTPC